MVQQFKKGVIELCVLKFIDEKDVYGYEIVKELGGIFKIKESTIYPILKRLNNDGYLTTYLIESNSGPARKYYKITLDGIEYYEENYNTWKELNDKIEKFLYKKDQ